jgi:hypothetical protein
MKKLTSFVASLAIVGLAMAPISAVKAQAQENKSPLTISQGDSTIHIFPTVGGATTLAPLLVDTGPLTYHGGPVMVNATTYAIFWLPSNLQTGTPTDMSALYRPVIKKFLTDYPGHGIDNNNTQYSQFIGGITTYIHNAGAFGGAFLDTSAYPASGCSDAATPGNCLTDSQIQKEVKKVMFLAGWTGGLRHIFLVFTSRGEGTCVDPSHCSYTFFCAYHGAFVNGAGTTIIYANMPYANTAVCQVGSTPSPNGDPEADDATTIASHEITEAITDPLLDAWFTAFGNEIGDLCAYNYGTLTWDSANANEFWNGDFYLLQQEFDNHIGGCAQLGP